MPSAGFFFNSLVISLCSLSVLVSAFSLSYVLPFVFTTHTTETYLPPAGLETCNLYKRSTSDFRLKPPNLWDWQIQTTERPALA